MRLKTQVTIVGLVALAGLMVGLALLARAEIGPLLAMQRAADGLERVALLDDLVHELQSERGLTAVARRDGVPEERLAAQYRRTDRAAEAASEAGVGSGAEPWRLGQTRKTLDAQALDLEVVFALYGRAVEPLLREAEQLMGDPDLDALRGSLGAHALLSKTKEEFGRLRSQVGLLLARPGLPGAAIRALQLFAVFESRMEETLREADPQLAGALHAALGSAPMIAVREEVERLATSGSTRGAGAPAHTPAGWFALASSAMDGLREVQRGSLASIRARAAQGASDARSGLAIRAALVIAGWLGSCYLVFVSLRRLLATIRRLDEQSRVLIGRLHAVTGAAELSAAPESRVGFVQLIEQVDRLGRQATSDALTSALNRHGLGHVYLAERARAERHGRPLSLVLLDLDHFKLVNDRFGHPAGDGVLRSLAALLQRQVRGVDIVARWGGEEFVVLLPECDEDAGAGLAERLRAAVAAHAFEVPRRVTASFGVAQARLGESLEDLVRRADVAMDRAKSLGRDRVCRASEEVAACADATFSTARQAG